MYFERKTLQYFLSTFSNNFPNMTRMIVRSPEMFSFYTQRSWRNICPWVTALVYVCPRYFCYFSATVCALCSQNYTYLH